MTEQQFATPRPVRLELRLAAGDVRVTTVDGDQSTVTLEGPQKVIDATRVALTGDRLVIEQRRRSGVGWFGHWQESPRVHARVPHRSDVEIVTASADARLDGTFGRLGMTSASGDLVVTGELDRDAQVKTVSGDVRLPRVGGVTVRTVSGNVAAEWVAGSVMVKSVSGDVWVGSLREGQVKVESVSGDIELGIASGASVDVDASSASGELSSEVPLSDTPSGHAGPAVVIRGTTVSGDFRVFHAAAKPPGTLAISR
jgi:Toastrack DUF4097